MRAGRGGFTLVEVLMVVLLVAILAGISVPMYSSATRRAEAARVLGDAHVIQLALREHLLQHARYPDTAEPGEVPPGLAPYLPDGFSFSRPLSMYRYRNWSQAGSPGPGLPSVGLEVLADDAILLRALEGLAQGRGTLASGSGLTLVLE